MERLVEYLDLSDSNYRLREKFTHGAPAVVVLAHTFQHLDVNLDNEYWVFVRRDKDNYKGLLEAFGGTLRLIKRSVSFVSTDSRNFSIKVSAYKVVAGEYSEVDVRSLVQFCIND